MDNNRKRIIKESIIALFICALGFAVIAIELNRQPPNKTTEHSLPPKTQYEWQLTEPKAIIKIDPYFSPRGGCTQAIVAEIDKAKNEILVQAYSFTSDPIAQALIKAQQRIANVQIIQDFRSRTERGNDTKLCADSGIKIFYDGKHKIHHNKIIIIDQTVVITGSFNFSASAEINNAENILIITDKNLAERYKANWIFHQLHSKGE